MLPLDRISRQDGEAADFVVFGLGHARQAADLNIFENKSRRHRLLSAAARSVSSPQKSKVSLGLVNDNNNLGQSIETAQRCPIFAFKSGYLWNCTLDRYTSLDRFLCLRPAVPLLKFQGNRICRIRDRSSMTDELPVNQLDPVPDP